MNTASADAAECSTNLPQNAIYVPHKKNAYKFQVMWDPLRKMRDLSTDIRDNILISQHRGDCHTSRHILQSEFALDTPLRIAVEKCRAKGIKILTGVWRYWENPLAILFDLDQMPRAILDRYSAELKRDHDIDVPITDGKCRKAIELSYCAAEFIIQFELAVGENMSNKSWVRFHNWSTAAGALFFSQWFANARARIAFFVSKTQLEELTPRNYAEAMQMADEASAGHRYALERTAADKAAQLVIGREVSSDLVERELFRKPTHRLRDAKSRMVHYIKHALTNKTKKLERRLDEPAYCNEEDTENDLKEINIPVIRTIRAKK